MRSKLSAAPTQRTAATEQNACDTVPPHRRCASLAEFRRRSGEIDSNHFQGSFAALKIRRASFRRGVPEIIPYISGLLAERASNRPPRAVGEATSAA